MANVVPRHGTNLRCVPQAAFFDMLSTTSQSHSTLRKYVISTILIFSILMLEPLSKPLEMVVLGLLTVLHLFELHFIFPNSKTILKPHLKKHESLFIQDWGITSLIMVLFVTQPN